MKMRQDDLSGFNVNLRQNADTGHWPKEQKVSRLFFLPETIQAAQQ